MPYCDILDIRKWIKFAVHDHFINVIHNLVSYLLLDGIFSEVYSLGKANCPAIDQTLLALLHHNGKNKGIKYNRLSQ